MKAIVLNEIGSVELCEVSDPAIEEARDAIVRVTTAGICGSDLHIVSGRDPGIRMGTIMGHEFTGVVESTGRGVAGFRAGDRVVAPFTVHCGSCFYCKRGLTARCVHSVGFGVITESGRGLHGAHAEYVRVPLASSTLMKIPDSVADQEVLFLGDIFATAYSCAENAAIREGDVVVVIGCGPVGLLAIKAARLFGPAAVVAVDSIDGRLEKARELGAVTVKPERDEVSKLVGELTDGRGADSVLEAVGSPGALDLALQIVRPGAVISIAGYHTEPSYALPIQHAYSKNLTLKIGRCSAGAYMKKLLPLVEEKRISLTDIVTHVLPLNEGARGYEIFSKRLENAIKVLLVP